MSSIPIIVLTPVKNESWILERFLFVTSTFADFIIIADQQSTDGSRQIALQFPKVVLIDNNNPEYDEGFRQRLLIDKAREICPERRILFTLDADEIMTADSLACSEWDRIRSLGEGTILRFEKPDLLSPPSHCIRHDSYFTLGYVDDGAEHIGEKIHSVRIPQHSNAVTIDFKKIKFMHYALTRPLEYKARQRMYSIIENIKSTTPFYHRLLKYSPRINDYVSKHEVSIAPDIWFRKWEDMGMDMKTIFSSEMNNYNIQVMRTLREYGARRFYWDDIWDVDWNALEGKVAGGGDSINIEQPGVLQRVVLTLIVRILRLLKG